ncbi:MAG: GntR family transcriptional regulator [Georgenia sp.]
MRASDRAYTVLREEIVSFRLEPGTELGEAEQAERLGLSRTPLREALARLAAEGLTVPGRGRTLVVSHLAADDVRHLFELRQALETQAAALASRRGDPAVFRTLADRFAAAGDLIDGDHGAYYRLVGELDTAIDEAMGSPYLRRALANLRAHVARARRLAHDNPDRLARSALEHRTIAEAIAQGDGVLAAHATAVHLHASLTHILQCLADADADAEADADADAEAGGGSGADTNATATGATTSTGTVRTVLEGATP